MQTIRRASQSLGQRNDGLPPASRLVLSLGLALGLLLLLVATGSQAAPLQQDTPSPSPSVSPSPSLTASSSVSPTLTLTASPATPTPSLTLAASATASLAPPPVVSPTWTELPAPTEPTAIPAPIEPVSTPTPAGPTPTLLPLPSVTYQFPQVSPPGELLVLAQPTAAEALPKGQSPFTVRFAPGRGWLLGGIILLWIGLGAWFALTQFIARRH